MLVVAICEAYGWSYEEYFDQPLPFLELIKAKMDIDAKRQKRDAESSKSKSRIKR